MRGGGRATVHDGVRLVVVHHVGRVVLDVPWLARPSVVLHGKDSVQYFWEQGPPGRVLAPAGPHEGGVGRGAPRRDLWAEVVLGDVVDNLEGGHPRVRVAAHEALPQDDPKAVDVGAPCVPKVGEDLGRCPPGGAERDRG